MLYCLQAEEQGLLMGNLNLPQVAARSVKKAHDAFVDGKEHEREMEERSELVELYIKLNFPELHEAVERNRIAQPDDEVKLDELSADDMDEMLQKMRAAAGMLE